MKRKVRVKVGSIGRAYEFTRKISDLVTYLQKFTAKYPDAFIDDEIEDYEDVYTYNVYVEREETDEEYALRIADEEDYRLSQVQYLQRQAAALGYNITPKE